MTQFKIVFVFLFAGMLLGLTFGTSHALPTTPTGYDWVDASYWSLTDRTTAMGGESSFTLTMERAAYESDFGFYTLTGRHDSKTSVRYRVFGADQEPGSAHVPTQQSVFFQHTGNGWEISLDNSQWRAFGDTFGFYFHVRDTGQTYYSDASLNSSVAERTNRHVLTAFNGHNSALIYLEDLPGLGDRDFEDMVIQGIDIAPAPVPEPGTMALMGVGLIGIAALHRRRSSKKKGH